MMINYRDGIVRLNKRGHVGIVFSKGLYQIVDSMDIDLTKEDFMKASKSRCWGMFDRKEIRLNEYDLHILFHYLGDAVLRKVGRKWLGKFDFVKICSVLFMKGVMGKDKWSVSVCLDCLNRVKNGGKKP